METRRLKKSRFLFYGLFLLAITAVFSMSASAVRDSTGLYEYKVVDGTAEITGSYLSYDVGAVTIPSWRDGYKVTTIGEKAFNVCSFLKNRFVKVVLAVIMITLLIVQKWFYYYDSAIVLLYIFYGLCIVTLLYGIIASVIAISKNKETILF